MEEEATSDIHTSAAVHGGKDESGEPVNGASGAGYGEIREVSLVEIMVLILVAKTSEKVFAQLLVSSSVLVSSRSS